MDKFCHSANVYERNCWAFQMGVRPFCQRVCVTENHLKSLKLCRIYTRISSICIFEKWTFLDLRYSIPNMKKTITVHPCMSCWSRYTRGFIFSPYQNWYLHITAREKIMYILHTYFVLHVYELFKFEYTNINNWNPFRKQFLGFWSFL